jgi:hypothetical protein
LQDAYPRPFGLAHNHGNRREAGPLGRCQERQSGTGPSSDRSSTAR